MGSRHLLIEKAASSLEQEDVQQVPLRTTKPRVEDQA